MEVVSREGGILSQVERGFLASKMRILGEGLCYRLKSGMHPGNYRYPDAAKMAMNAKDSVCCFNTGSGLWRREPARTVLRETPIIRCIQIA